MVVGRQFCASLIHGLSKYISKFFRCSCTVHDTVKKKKKMDWKTKAVRGEAVQKKFFTQQSKKKVFHTAKF
jgi:hypothetical protein